MSIITDNIGVAKSVTVDLPDTPLDGRTRCDSVEDFPNIEHPYVGMQIYTISDGKTWVVKTLTSKVINGITFPNMTIDTYEEYSGVTVTDDGRVLIGDIELAKMSDVSSAAEAAQFAAAAAQSAKDADDVFDRVYEWAEDTIGGVNALLDKLNGEVV